MTATTVSSATAGPAPSNASLSGLDGVNFFNAGILAGFGPYVAAYLADQKWTQENIGFVLTASGLAGLLSQIPGGELLDTVRSKRAIVAAGATIGAISALIIALQPSFPLVFTALMLQGSTGGFLGPAIVAISLGLVGHAALPERLGRNQRFSSTGNLLAAALMGPDRIFLVVPGDIPGSCRTHPSAVHRARSHPCSRHSLRPRLRRARSRHA
jgi:MFS family permease